MVVLGQSDRQQNKGSDIQTALDSAGCATASEKRAAPLESPILRLLSLLAAQNRWRRCPSRSLAGTMFLTVYLSNNDQHFTEVPITPETVCRDVVELCKEPGESDCHLSEMWRGSERAVGEGERMLELLQRWGSHRGEVRFFLRHNRAPGREAGETGECPDTQRGCITVVMGVEGESV
ncbi:hypothetical protein NFI96_000980 [Prochilodus magdalenae]|nr:hypothetical protein NFI96_000980 [Prochilodus magdalenae]